MKLVVLLCIAVVGGLVVSHGILLRFVIVYKKVDLRGVFFFLPNIR